MPRRLLWFIANIAALFALVVALTYVFPPSNTPPQMPPQQNAAPENTQSAAVSIALVEQAEQATSSPRSSATASSKTNPPPRVQTVEKAQSKATVQPNRDQASRIQNPYSFPPSPSTVLNANARAALVNILCMPHGGTLLPTSGSGVLIDPRGVILTNAHVAQYVLLSQDPRVDLTCYIRTGAPATAHYSAKVLYIPPVWVQAHASEINDMHPTGTGENDYALLLIDGSTDGNPLPATFPYVSVDTREAIGFTGDPVLVASYPAEFIGGLAAENSLFPASSFTTIGQLITFHSSTVDLISLGGVIEAQSGSSGGAVVNAWDRLVGLIVTTSSGSTTAVRDLRAITPSYINRDLLAQSGQDLASILAGDVKSEADTFDGAVVPNLVSFYMPFLK